MVSVTLIHTCSPRVPGSMSGYAAMVSEALQLHYGAALAVRHCHLYAPESGGSMWRHHVWRWQHARQALAAEPADGYHLLDGSMAAFVPRALRARTLVTVHDMIPFLQARRMLPGQPSIPARWLMRRSAAALSAMGGLAADSTCTLQDVQTYAGAGGAYGRVLPLAVRAFPPEAEAGKAIVPQTRYLLHVGNQAAYKNREGVLDVVHQLQDCKDLALVMVGPEPSAALRAKAQALHLPVYFLVDIDDVALGCLYRAAALLLFPSLYEGFGMPVLEAMSLGCPVVCSEAGSLPEVAGGAALTATPDDVAALAAHCRDVLTNATLRAELQEKGRQHAASFTLARFGQALAQWYEEAWNRWQQ